MKIIKGNIVHAAAPGKVTVLEGGCIVLRDDGPNGDLGYPATVELSDGSLFTVYYQAAVHDEPTGIMYTHWELPDGLK